MESSAIESDTGTLLPAEEIPTSLLHNKDLKRGINEVFHYVAE
jgi:hypothetical protein